MDDDPARHDDAGDRSPRSPRPDPPSLRSPRPDLRVGDADRQAALQALGTHFQAGRLDVDEYGDRAGRATVAVRCADLAALFDDLPAPHPALPERGLPAVAVPADPPGIRPDRRSGAQAAAFALVMIMMIALPGLLIAAGAAGVGVGGGGLLFLPLIFMLAGGARHGRRFGPGGRGHGHGGRG